MGEIGVDLVTAHQLSKYLDSSVSRNRTLVVDCRSFTSYNQGHITGAHNVYCPPILKRRCTDGIPLSYIVRSTEARDALIRGEFDRVILYDDSTRSTDELIVSSDVRLAATALEKSAGTSPVTIQLLKGGFETFSSQYDRFCTWSNTLPMTGLISMGSPDTGSHNHQTSHRPSISLTGPLSAGRQPPLATFGRALNMNDKSTSTIANCSSTKDDDGPDEIRTWLYLGSRLHATRPERLQELGITSLLNVAATPSDSNCSTPSGNAHFSASEGISTSASDNNSSSNNSHSFAWTRADHRNDGLKSSCDDGLKSPTGRLRSLSYMSIPLRDNATADISCWFPQCFNFIDEVRRSGGKVLVHCQAGISRSAAICIAYLMNLDGLSMDAAHDFVKSRRSIIAPNLNFMRQLYEFESQLRRRRLAAVTALATPRFPRSPRRYIKPLGTPCLATLSPFTPDSVSPRTATTLFVFDSGIESKERRTRLTSSSSYMPSSRHYHRQFTPASSLSPFNYGILIPGPGNSARTVEKSCCMFDLSKSSTSGPSPLHCTPIIPSQ